MGNQKRQMMKVEISIYLEEPTYDKMDDDDCEEFESYVEDALEGPINAAVEHAKESLKKELSDAVHRAMTIDVRGLG